VQQGAKDIAGIVDFVIVVGFVGTAGLVGIVWAEGRHAYQG